MFENNVLLFLYKIFIYKIIYKLNHCQYLYIIHTLLCCTILHSLYHTLFIHYYSWHNIIIIMLLFNTYFILFKQNKCNWQSKEYRQTFVNMEVCAQVTTIRMIFLSILFILFYICIIYYSIVHTIWNCPCSLLVD